MSNIANLLLSHFSSFPTLRKVKVEWLGMEDVLGAQKHISLRISWVDT